MLKIKDNVDLKELEKYGFNKGFKFYEPPVLMYIDTDNCLYFTNGTPWWNMEYYYNYDSDVIVDLISDGLVEKVEDK